MKQKKRGVAQEDEQPRFIHLGNNYILDLDTLAQYYCCNGRIDSKYKGKATREAIVPFDLLADNNGRRIESQFLFNEDFANLNEKYFIFELDKALFEMSSELERSDLLVGDESQSISEQ